MNKKLAGGPLALILPVILFGCLDQNPQDVDVASEEQTAPKSANNSDPGKAGYLPDMSLEKREPSRDLLDFTPGYQGIKEYVELQKTRPLAKAASAERWVGVLPQYQAGYDACPTANRVRIRMDDEDSGNNSRATSTLPMGAGDNDGSNTTLLFCKVPGNTLHSFADAYYNQNNYVSNEFAVLQLDDQCPDESISIGFHEDNEDSGNNNSNSGNIWPNQQTGSLGATIWRFCYFRSRTNMSKGYLPALSYVGKDYAVFTMPSSGGMFKQRSWVYADDEDSGNDNAYQWLDADADDKVRFKRIISSSSSGTYFNMGTVTIP